MTLMPEILVPFHSSVFHLNSTSIGPVDVHFVVLPCHFSYTSILEEKKIVVMDLCSEFDHRLSSMGELVMQGDNASSERTTSIIKGESSSIRKKLQIWNVLQENEASVFILQEARSYRRLLLEFAW
ncbi:unnamed protein product [Victoria cruziana]